MQTSTIIFHLIFNQYLKLGQLFLGRNYLNVPTKTAQSYKHLMHSLKTEVFLSVIVIAFVLSSFYYFLL